MRMQSTLLAGLAVVLAATSGHAQTNRLTAAAEAMGANGLNSIEYTGSGFVFGFGQAYEPGGAWPRFIQRTYDASINYQTPGMRLVQVRSQGEHPPRGGAAQPVAADQRTVAVVSGKSAWQEDGAQPAPNPAAVEDRLLQLWATPQGVIKAALANGSKVDGNTVTVSIDGREVKATLNAQNLVEKVSYLSTSEVVGDFPVDIAYTDYADFGGVKFPRHIVQTEDGFPTLDITVNAVKPNAAVSVDVPGTVRQAAPPATRVNVNKLADGVWYLSTPNAHSWAVEFKDHVVVVEGIASEARSLAVMDEVAEAHPQQADPLRHQYSCALRSCRRAAHLCGEGRDRRHARDEQAVLRSVPGRGRARSRPTCCRKRPGPATFETVSDKKVMTDGTQDDRDSIT